MPVREVNAAERLTYPYSAIGVMIAYWPDGTRALATAAMVGRNDILTATHTVYSPEHGGWGTKFDFYFGADYNNITDAFDSTTFSYSLKAGTYSWTARAYPDSVFSDSSSLLSLAESQYDVAVLGVSVPVGDFTGYLGIDPNRNYSQVVTEVGYPDGGSGMMTSDVAVSSNAFYGVYSATTNAMGPGSSGGPLLSSDNYVIGVKSGGNSTTSVWADIGFTLDAFRSFLTSNDSLMTAATQGVPRYSVSATTTSVNEGSSASFVISTQNVPAGSILSYQLSGVSAADIVGGQLTGLALVGNDGKAVATIGITADLATEGVEVLTLTSNGASASITINDTSTTPRAATPTTAELIDALGVYRAFHGAAPLVGSYGILVTYVRAFGVAGYAASVASSFAGFSADSLASSVLGDFGVTSATLGGSTPSASYAAIHSAVSLIFTVNTAAKGQVVLNMTRLLAGLEADAVYGAAARNFDRQILGDYARLAGSAATSSDAVELAQVVGGSPIFDVL